MTDQQRKMQAGRERAAKQRRKEGVAKVKAYRAWLKADVQHTMNMRAYEAGIGKHPGRRPRMPALPSSYDFEVADGKAA